VIIAKLNYVLLVLLLMDRSES